VAPLLTLHTYLQDAPVYCPTGETVTTIGTILDCCPVSANCRFATACSAQDLLITILETTGSGGKTTKLDWYVRGIVLSFPSILLPDYGFGLDNQIVCLESKDSDTGFGPS